MRTLRILFALMLLGSAVGCVSVENRRGLNPPRALCSKLRATIGCPKGSVPCGNQVRKIGRYDGSFIVKEWVYSGISANVVDMALKKAIENGGLEKVHYAEFEQTSYFGFVTVFNVAAYGE